MKNIKKLAKELTSREIALIIMEKSNRSNCNLEVSLSELNKLNKNKSIILHSIQEELNDLNEGFIFHKSLSNNDEEIVKNMDGILEILINKENGIKRKYIETNYYAIEHMIEAELIGIKDNEAEYQLQILYAKPALWDLVKVNLIEDETYVYRCNFDIINTKIRNYLTKTLHLKKEK